MEHVANSHHTIAVGSPKDYRINSFESSAVVTIIIAFQASSSSTDSLPAARGLIRFTRVNVLSQHDRRRLAQMASCRLDGQHNVSAFANSSARGAGRPLKVDFSS